MAKIIFYPSGCYGNWVNWLVHYLSDSSISNQLPFGDKHGNESLSHGFMTNKELLKTANHLGFFGEEVLVSGTSDIKLLHPHRTDRNINDQVARLLESDNSVIWLYADECSQAWLLNNRTWKILPLLTDHDYLYFFSKKYINDHDDQELVDQFDYIFKDHKTKLLTQWPQEYDDNGILDKWIIREFLSQVIDPATEAAGIKQYHLPSAVLSIEISELRDNFKETILKILDHFNLKVDRTDVDYEYLYREWIKRQPHAYKDKLIHNIIDSTINDNLLEWEELTIIDESLIQYLLREQGYEIKCHGLNEFPTNSKHLRELIYATQ